MDLYPTNTLADYTIKLPKAIILNKPYTVAIEEFIYPQPYRSFNSREVYIEKMKIEDGEFKVAERYWVDMTSNDNVHSMINYLNHNILEACGWFLTNHAEKSRHLRIEHDVKAEAVHPLQMHPKLAHVLGLGNGFGYTSILVPKDAPFPCHLYEHNQQMFIYGDFVEHQVVGDTLAPLLRICVAQQSTKSLISEKYIRPYYVPVCKDRIEEVHIQVRNHVGELYPFPTGAPLIIKLHFKPA
jgi:hypothetical protein